MIPRSRFRLAAFAVAALLLFALGCGHKEAKSASSNSLETRLIYLNTDINLLRGELQETARKCNGCGEGKCSVADSKRLSALLDHASAFSRVTAVYFEYAKPDVDLDLDEEAGEAMNDALREAREIVNRNAILFDLPFNKDVDWYYEVFRQMNHLPVKEWAEYRVCIAGLTNSFDGICKDQIGRIDGSGDRGIRMPLPGITYEDRIGMTPRKYLKAVRQKWEKHR